MKRPNLEALLLLAFLTASVAYVGLLGTSVKKTVRVAKKAPTEEDAGRSCDFPPKPDKKECPAPERSFQALVSPAVKTMPNTNIRQEDPAIYNKNAPKNKYENTIVIKKVVTKIVKIQQVVEKKTSLSMLVLARPGGVYFENNGSITTIQNHYAPDIGVLYQKDFDDLRISAGVSIGGIAFFGAGFSF